MLSAIFTGFILGLSLIVAIGAQNAFVIRQGITGKHVFFVALFCAVSDSILISIGVTGASVLLNQFFNDYSNIFFGLTSVWLFGYGLMRLNSSFKGNTFLEVNHMSSNDFKTTFTILIVITFGNPHVYLDTTILIGAISQQFSDMNKIAFAGGAITASFVFFFSLAYSAKFFAPMMQSRRSWRILDFIIALIMFTISIKLAFEGNWL
jgi:L-lysine exporter family protein LysE/ArgO